MTACNECKNHQQHDMSKYITLHICYANELAIRRFDALSGNEYYIPVYCSVVNKGNCKYFKPIPPKIPQPRLTKEGGNFNLLEFIKNMFKH